MPLRPPTDRFRERILSIGGPGMGKSRDGLSIADLANKTNSDAHFHIIDTDVSVNRMLYTEFPDLDTSGTVTTYDAEDWTTLLETAKKIKAIARPQDWMIIDLLTPSWDWAQSHGCQAVYGKDLKTYLTEARAAAAKSGKKEDKNGPQLPWDLVKKEYSDLEGCILRFPGHVYCTGEVKPLDRGRDPQELILTYGAYGVRPDGNKKVGHRFRTTIWKTRPVAAGPYLMTTIRDNGRTEMQGEPVGNFATSYLCKRAGWSLA